MDTSEEILQELKQKIDDSIYNKTNSGISKDLWVSCWVLTLEGVDYEAQIILLERILLDIRNHVNKECDEINTIPTLSIVLLEKYVQIWKNFKLFIFLYYKLFEEFTKKVNNDEHNKGILFLGFEYFKNILIIPSLTRLVKTILFHVNQERINKQVHTLDFRLMIESFIEAGYGSELCISQGANQQDIYYHPIGIKRPHVYEKEQYMKFYREEFERTMLKEIEELYTNKTIEWLAYSVPEYCKIALSYFEDEVKIAEQYYSLSINFIKTNLVRIMILEKYTILAHNATSGIFNLLEKDDVEGIKSVYKLFKLSLSDKLVLSPPVEEITNIIGKYIQKYVDKILNNTEIKDRPNEITNGLIKIRKYIMEIVKEACEFNAVIDTRTRREFDNAINSKTNTIDLACIFAQYLDSMLIEEAKNNAPEAEVDARMDDYLDVISGLSDKDHYINWYRHYLAPRLLEKPSLDLESKFIGKMSQKWGQANFHVLKTMINDINNSSEFNIQCQKDNIIPRELMDFNIKLLTQSSWPQTIFNLNGIFHENFSKPMKKIEDYYKSKTTGRNISWCFNKGEVELRRPFNNKIFKFSTTTLQANILLQFNDQTQIEWGQIKAKLGLTAKLIQVWDETRILLKVGILKRNRPMNAEEEKQIPDDEEKLNLNESFNSSKLLIGCIVKAGARKKEDDLNQKIEKDTLKEREFLLDASIVRIMKSRRELLVTNLQEEVKKIITLFTPDPKIVKKRVESLIEREYLLRSDDDINRLIYKP